MTPVTIDRKDIEEAKRACAFMGFEYYFMDRKDDTDQVTMIVDSEKPFELWHIARAMQSMVMEKTFMSL